MNSQPPIDADEIAARVAARLTPPAGMAEFGPSSRLGLTAREAAGVVSAVVLMTATVLGAYYAATSAMAQTETTASQALAASTETAKTVAEHATRLEVARVSAKAQREDLDRRFGEVKAEQKASETRILEAVRELRADIRKGR